MTKFLTTLSIVFFLTIQSKGQGIDSLKLLDKEIPEGYSLTNNKNCISIQACTLYENPEIYGALLGHIKNKQVQNFDSKKDNGSIMYFEFEDGFKGDGFLGGLLWGGNKPTKEHPEEYFAKGNYLIVWSFKKGSLVTKTSKEKIKAALR